MKRLIKDSEINRLEWLLDSIPDKFELRKKKHEKSQIFVFTANALVRLATEICRGIIVLLKIDNNESAAMLERNLYELWCEIRYLIDNSEEGAAKMNFNSIFEFKEFFQSSQAFQESEYSKELDSYLKKLKAIYPDEKNTIVQQRANRKFHWSGMSRTNVIKNVAADGDTSIYKLLSWESHTVMTSLRDMLSSNSGKIVLGEGIPEMIQCNQIAYRATGYLLYLYNEFAEVFDYTEINIEDYGS